MARYSKRVRGDAFEMVWMKRLVGRGNEPLSLVERMTAGYFLLANSMGDSTYHPATREAAEARRTVWQAFLNGNVLPMRFYIENHAIKEKWVVQIQS